jgi:para-nitrobenzyl esterase
LVWVHGGGFVGGAASDVVHDGRSFARDHRVVVATVGYRLGVFGWLHLGHLGKEAPGGNYGLLDVLAALRWLNENITAFGGDENNITLGGQSAGAIIAATLMAHPEGPRLFRRVIAQSGSAQHAKSADRAAAVAEQFLEKLGSPSIEQLRAAPADKLLGAQAEVLARHDRTWCSDPHPSNFLALGPVVDGVVVEEDPLLRIAAGASAGMGLLVGSVAREWHTFGDGSERGEEVLRAGVFEAFGKNDHAAVSELIDAYGRILSNRGECWAALFTDMVFRIPAIRLAEAHGNHAGATYMYRFDWEPRGQARPGFHSLEVVLVFDNEDLPGMKLMFTGGQSPDGLAASTSNAWSSFVRSGEPSCPALSDWTPYGNERATALIDAEWSVECDPERQRRRLWRGLI